MINKKTQASIELLSMMVIFIIVSTIVISGVYMKQYSARHQQIHEKAVINCEEISLLIFKASQSTGYKAELLVNNNITIDSNNGLITLHYDEGVAFCTIHNIRATNGSSNLFSISGSKLEVYNNGTSVLVVES